MDNLVFSFPRMGNYHVVMERAVRSLFPDASVLPPQPVTERTLELGARYSPDDVCAPFKYNLGGFIQSLEHGANVLLQIGFGCVCAYYGELQELILHELGYNFEFLCFSRGQTSLDLAVKTYRELGGTRSPKELAGTLVFGLACIRVLDEFEYRIREIIGFETIPGSFNSLHRRFLNELRNVSSIPSLISLRNRFLRELQRIEINKPDDAPRVGIIGELYTVMEPSVNFEIERLLAEAGISVSRLMNVSYLLKPHSRRSMRDSRGYLRHLPGATGADSVAHSIKYAKNGYDGILHIKSCGCTPEVNAMPTLLKIGHDYNIPVLCLSFDTQTAEAGVQTRLEAFTDMIRMRRNHSI